jgi:hypothetical protein
METVAQRSLLQAQSCFLQGRLMKLVSGLREKLLALGNANESAAHPVCPFAGCGRLDC